MRQDILELAAAFFGPLGLGVLFHLRKELLIPGALGGLVNRILFVSVQ